MDRFQSVIHVHRQEDIGKDFRISGIKFCDIGEASEGSHESQRESARING